MLTLSSPYTKSEIQAALQQESAAVHTFFADIDADRFFVGPKDIWTPADNLIHLIMSVSSIVTALTVPRTVLRMRFGKAKHESRDIHTVITVYQAFLAAGGVAPAQYEPLAQATDAAEKARILEKWQSKMASLVDAIGGWSEAQLDAFQVKHPLIGSLTIREVLLFTLYHNMHHVNDVHDLYGNPHETWFT